MPDLSEAEIAALEPIAERYVAQRCPSWTLDRPRIAAGGSAAVLRAAGIGQLKEGVAKGFEQVDVRRAAGAIAIAIGEARFAIIGDLRGAQQHAGVFGEGLEPESFGAVVGEV